MLDGTENCDDGNTFDGDGCTSVCMVQSGWECSGLPSNCNRLCSNGMIDTGENCDDGNSMNGDGCSNSCNV